MTLKDLYIVSDINLKVTITTGTEDIFSGAIGQLRYSQMNHTIEDISQHKDGTLIIIVKEE